jgi:hypothetical protein
MGHDRFLRAVECLYVTRGFPTPRQSLHTLPVSGSALRKARFQALSIGRCMGISKAMNCLGVSWLPECVYNPAAPSAVYFTIGDGVAALSLLLLIPQIIKPLYEFRLGMIYIRKQTIYGVAIFSFLGVLVSAAIPQSSVASWPLVGWPVFWEICAGLGFLFSYCVLAYAYLFPARADAGSVEKFARGAAKLIAHASPVDHVDFAPEIRNNIGTLIRLSRSADLKRAQKDAIYSFRYRSEIKDASFSISLLEVLSDPSFCRSLVSRCPWDAAAIVDACYENGAGWRSGASFIQEVARQSIVCDESIIGREAGYVGLARAPVLSHSLFGNHRLNRGVNPFQGLRHDDFDGSNEQYVQRLNHAALIALRALFEDNDVWEATNLYNLERHYGGVILRTRSGGARGSAWRVASALGQGISTIIEGTRAYLAALPPEERRTLYFSDPDKNDNAIDAVAELTVELWNTISNGFAGIDDDYWFAALDTWQAVFPQFGNELRGMDPLQQRVALKVGKKVDDNMKGWYPALTRLCLAMLDPFGAPSEPKVDSAIGLVRRDFYFRIRRLRDFAQQKPDKVQDYLPPNVTYDSETGTLIYTYTSGPQHRTVLSELPTAQVSFDPEVVAV